MSGTVAFDKHLEGKGLRIAVVASRFNDDIVAQLVAGAMDALRRHGVADSDVNLVLVPGAWELPFAVRQAVAGGCDAVVALGCVIRGDTPHFEYVAGECARGLMDAQRDTGVPVAFGVLTVETDAQAAERADVKRGNKGGEAALTAIEMAQLVARLNPKRGGRDGR